MILKNNKGMALPLVMMISAFLISLGAVMMRTTLAEIRFNQMDQNQMQAYYIARSVADAMKSKALEDPLLITSIAGDQGSAGRLSFAGGDAEVYITPLEAGGIPGVYSHTIISRAVYRERESEVTIDLERQIDNRENHLVFNHLVSTTHDLSLNNKFKIQKYMPDGLMEFIADYSVAGAPRFAQPDEGNHEWLYYDELYRSDDDGKIYTDTEKFKKGEGYQTLYPAALPEYVDEFGHTRRGFKESLPPLSPPDTLEDVHAEDGDRHVFDSSGVYDSLTLDHKGTFQFKVDEGRVLQIQADSMIFNGEIEIISDTAEPGALHLLVGDYLALGQKAKVGPNDSQILIIFSEDLDGDTVDLFFNANPQVDFFVYGPGIEAEFGSAADFRGALVVSKFRGSDLAKITYAPMADSLHYEISLFPEDHVMKPTTYR